MKAISNLTQNHWGQVKFQCGLGIFTIGVQKASEWGLLIPEINFVHCFILNQTPLDSDDGPWIYFRKHKPYLHFILFVNRKLTWVDETLSHRGQGSIHHVYSMPWLLMTWHPKLTISEFPDSKVHGANMGPTWVLSAPDGSHVGPMNLAWDGLAWTKSWSGWEFM